MRLSLVCVVAVASILAIGCGLTGGVVSPLDAQPPASGKGTLVLTLRPGPLGAKTLEPPISMEVASFDIAGMGPDPAHDSFEDLGNTTGQLVLNSLAPGLWSVAVDARNAGGTVVGHGQTDSPVLITAGAITSVQIDITPAWRDWHAGPHCAVDQRSASKRSCGVFARFHEHGCWSWHRFFSLIPSKDPMKATYQNTGIEAGYYLLFLRLYDGSVQFWGTVEAVRIVAGQTTSQTWTVN